MANDLQQLALLEKSSHFNYLRDFRVEQCQLFLQHKCTQHRPFSCFYWHFQNQRRRRPTCRKDGTFSYDPDFYCNDYDEQSGICPHGDDCLLLHRNANDTEKRYHLRYYKTGICTHESDSKGHCTKNGLHCSYAHGANDLRQPILDSREVQNTNLALERLARLCISLENERALNDDPKWNESYYVLSNYKTEPCKRPPRLCRQGYACPQFHNPRDRRRNPSIFKYKSTPCPNVKQSDEWIDPGICESGDSCKYCHTRTEQQFHPEIYKSTKCNDVSVTGYCPRGPFCAFAHIEQEMKSYRDFDIHHNSELPLSSFIPIPEDNETETSENVDPVKNIPKKSSYSSLFETGSFLGSQMKSVDQQTSERHPSAARSNIVGPNINSSLFSSRDMSQQMKSPSSQQNRLVHGYQQPAMKPTVTPSAVSQFLNDPIFLSAAAIAASHSYPPPSSFLSPLMASNYSSSNNYPINSTLFEQHSSTAYSAEKSSGYFTNEPKHRQKGSAEYLSSPIDVKDLIGSSLTAIGLDHVNEDDFDKAATSEPNNDMLLIESDIDSFERSNTPATNNTSPTHTTNNSSTSSNNQISRPVNIPQTFAQNNFLYSSSAKSPFDIQHQLIDNSLDSPISTPFPEPSTSSGSSQRPGELYKMAGFSQDLPTSSPLFSSSSPQSILHRLSITSHQSLSPSSSTEIDMMRNCILKMHSIAITEKESSDHWRKEAEEKRRLATQLESDRTLAMQQRDQAIHKIEHMRQLLLQNIRLLPNDQELMQLSLEDIHSLQAKLQQDLARLSMIEQVKYQSSPKQVPAPPGLASVTNSAVSPRQRQQQKYHGGKNVSSPSSSSSLPSSKH